MSETIDDSSMSVTEWMHDALRGNDDARTQLWHRYFERLLRLARSRLTSRLSRAADEEDVVLEAFNAFFEGVGPSQLDAEANREDLWRILVRITERKTIDHIRKEQREKRGGGNVVGHSFGGSEEDAFQQIPDPHPEFADRFSITCDHLLSSLSEDLHLIAMRRFAGYTNLEISKELGCCEENVRRKVEFIRQIWTKTGFAEG